MATFIKQLTFSNGRATAATAANPTEADLSLSDVTTLNVSTTQHGFAPKAPNDATKFLDGTGAYSVPAGAITINNGPGISGGGTGTTFTLSAQECVQRSWFGV